MNRLAAVCFAVLCVFDIDEDQYVIVKCVDLQPDPPSILVDIHQADAGMMPEDAP